MEWSTFLRLAPLPPSALGLAVLLGLCTSSNARAEDDAWLGRDKALHFGVSAALSASAYGLSAIVIEHPGYRYLVGVTAGLSVGAAKELWDAAGHGDPSLKDFTWDVLGTLAGATLALGVDLLYKRVQRRAARRTLVLLRF